VDFRRKDIFRRRVGYGVHFFGLLIVKNYGQLGLRYLYTRLALGTIRVRHRNNLFAYIENEYNRSKDAMIITMKTRRRLRGQVKIILNIGSTGILSKRGQRTNFVRYRSDVVLTGIITVINEVEPANVMWAQMFRIVRLLSEQ